MPLSELRVLDLSLHDAGALVAMALADCGASVLRLDRPTIAQESPAWMHRGKHLFLEDPELASILPILGQRADIVIEDCPRGGLRFGPESLPNASGVIHLWMPAFAQEDPLHPLDAPEGALEAACALHETPVGLSPHYTELAILSTSAAAYGLNGVLAALWARASDGLGQRVELPRADVAFSLLELNALLTQAAPRTWATLQWASTPFIAPYETSDGRFIYLHAGLRRHLARLLDALGELVPAIQAKLRDVLSPQTLADPTSVASSHEQRRVQALLAEAFLTHPAWFWEQRLSERGLCVAPVQTAAQWHQHPHAKASRQVLDSPRGTTVPGLLFEVDELALDPHALEPIALPGGAQAALERWPPRDPPPGRDPWLKGGVQASSADASADDASSDSPSRASMSAQAQAQAHAPLRGVRVLDLTQVIAGPVATRTLAELGATVHRIDNPRFDAPWVEPFHIAYNAGKTQQTLDLTDPQDLDAFWALVERMDPDIILHNLRPGAAERLGIGQAAFRERAPGAIYVHLSAYGARGPWALRPGWEQTAQAACGAQLLDKPQQTPSLHPLPMTDLATGLLGAAAALVALLRRAQDGQPHDARACLSATATHITARYARPGLTHTAYGRHPLHRLYKARDGWLFLSVSALQERALLRLVGLEHIPAYSGKLRERALERALLEAPVQVWLDRMLRADLQWRVCLVPRRTQRQLFELPRARHEQLIFVRDRPGLGPLHEASSALRLSRTPTLHPLDAAPPRQASPHRLDTLDWLKRQAGGALALLRDRRRRR